MDHAPEFRAWYQDQHSSRTSHSRYPYQNHYQDEEKTDDSRNSWENQQETKEEDTTNKFKSITKKKYVGFNRYSPYFFININYLGHIGGIELISEFVANNGVISSIALGLEILSEIYGYLENDYSVTVVLNKIIDPIKEIPHRISDDEVKVSRKEDFAKLLKYVENIFGLSHDGNDLKMIVNQFELEILLV